MLPKLFFIFQIAETNTIKLIAVIDTNKLKFYCTQIKLHIRMNPLKNNLFILFACLINFQLKAFIYPSTADCILPEFV